MSAAEYLEKNGVQQAVEKAINSAVAARPDEPYSYLSKELIEQAPAKIIGVKARQIFDSRGNPTLEVEVETYRGWFRAAVPAGASTGEHEAAELRDGGSDYDGRGVSKAIANVEEKIRPAVLGLDPRKQKVVDDAMIALDGTPNKSSLGANAILAVSLATARAGAAEKGVPLYRHIADLAGNADKLVLPVPSFNIINGGVHAGNALAFQEFMILPIGASSFKEAMKLATEVYHKLKGIIKKQYGVDSTNVGDEGGFAPPIATIEAGLDLIVEAIRAAGHEGKVKVGVDSAASEFYDAKSDTYDLDFKREKNDGSCRKTRSELNAIYQSLYKKYPLVFFEDPYDENDWAGFAEFTAEGDYEVIGDDLLCTNPVRVQKAIDLKACNALLLKVNQIGTLTESIDAVKLAKSAGFGVMTSHRSGETEDPFIADLAVGLATGQIKSGAPCRSERLAKYNQLLRIEEQLGDKSVYAGKDWRFIAI